LSEVARDDEPLRCTTAVAIGRSWGVVFETDGSMTQAGMGRSTLESGFHRDIVEIGGRDDGRSDRRLALLRASGTGNTVQAAWFLVPLWWQFRHEEAPMFVRTSLAMTVVLTIMVWGISETAMSATGRSARPACTITGSDGEENHLRGTSGPDVICALIGDDEIFGLGGDDVIFAGPGRDIVVGGGGDDRIFGNEGSDLAYGGPGNDELFGQRAGDDLRGNHGRDRLYGGRANDGCLSATDQHPGDRVYGGPGHDRADSDTGDRLFSVEETALLCYAE
jgi:hypothetical protein